VNESRWPRSRNKHPHLGLALELTSIIRIITIKPIVPKLANLTPTGASDER